VRVDARQAGALGGKAHEVADGLPSERLAALGQEQPGQVAPPRGTVAPDRAQLVAGDGLLDGQPALEPMHPQHGAVQVQFVQPQADGSLTRRSWRNIVSSGWSRVPCRPALAASSKAASSAAVRKSLARSCPSAAPGAPCPGPLLTLCPLAAYSGMAAILCCCWRQRSLMARTNGTACLYA